MKTIIINLIRCSNLTQEERMINYLNEDELYYNNECSDCVDKDFVLCDARKDLKKIISILFGQEGFDKVKLENCIDSLCSTLDVNVPNGQIVVQETQEAHIKRWNQMVKQFSGVAQ